MDKKKLKESALQAIEREKSKIIGWSEAIAGKPELGTKKPRRRTLIRSGFRRPGSTPPAAGSRRRMEGVLEGGRPPGPACCSWGRWTRW